jgi:hypothetical protein
MISFLAENRVVYSLFDCLGKCGNVSKIKIILDYEYIEKRRRKSC